MRDQGRQAEEALAQESGADGVSARPVAQNYVASSTETIPRSPRNRAGRHITECATEDSPYNIGIDYGAGAHVDRLADDKYLSWCRQWMRACARLLTEDGSLWVMINDEYADHFGLLLRETGLIRRSWIKWYETFGVNCTNNFNRCSRHIFYCVKNAKQFVFNADAVSRPSDRLTKYHDRRADSGGKLWDNVWCIPRLVENSQERLPDFPTQLPLQLLRAIVGCASHPGDLVLDPFSGSGTTGAAAVESGRRYVGIERNPQFADLSRQRIAAIRQRVEGSGGR